MTYLRYLYARLRAAFPPNRIVVALTPLLAGLAGSIATWLAEHFPGIELSQDDLTKVFIAGALAAVVSIYKWLDGWIKFEQGENGLDGEYGLLLERWLSTLGDVNSARAELEERRKRRRRKRRGPYLER